MRRPDVHAPNRVGRLGRDSNVGGCASRVLERGAMDPAPLAVSVQFVPAVLTERALKVATPAVVGVAAPPVSVLQELSVSAMDVDTWMTVLSFTSDAAPFTAGVIVPAAVIVVGC